MCRPRLRVDNGVSVVRRSRRRGSSELNAEEIQRCSRGYERARTLLAYVTGPMRALHASGGGRTRLRFNVHARLAVATFIKGRHRRDVAEQTFTTVSGQPPDIGRLRFRSCHARMALTAVVGRRERVFGPIARSADSMCIDGDKCTENLS